MKNIYTKTFTRKDLLSDWEINGLSPFNRFIISWNGTRFLHPCHIEISLLYDTWTDLVRYATWGVGIQRSYSYQDSQDRFRICQDEIIINDMSYKKMKVHVTDSSSIHRLYLSALQEEAFNEYADDEIIDSDTVILSPKHRYSQFGLNLEYSHRICSPVSLMNAMSFLDVALEEDPSLFVNGVYDQAFDIFGNWVLNVAHVSSFLKKYNPKVERLSSFKGIYRQLCNHKPVVVSLSGLLTGAPQSYSQGHLVVVYGWDNKTKQVCCIDSAFAFHDQTQVKYDCYEFINAWKIKKYLTYTF
ncbi:MAG: C39 family peptidase [Chlamydiales bacterium]|nr:C39 family peptidase [Chlamydiales bacterium]